MILKKIPFFLVILAQDFTNEVLYSRNKFQMAQSYKKVVCVFVCVCMCGVKMEGKDIKY